MPRGIGIDVQRSMETTLQSFDMIHFESIVHIVVYSSMYIILYLLLGNLYLERITLDTIIVMFLPPN